MQNYPPSTDYYWIEKQEAKLNFLDKLCLRCANAFKDISGLCFKCKKELRDK